MAELIKIEYKSLPKLYVVGAEIIVNMNQKDNPIPAFWGKCFQDGVFNTFAGKENLMYGDAYVGYMDNWDQQTGEFRYICGVLLTELFDGCDKLTVRELQPCTVADGLIKSNEPSDAFMNAHPLTENAFTKDGKKPDFDNFWCAEVYPDGWDTKDENGNISINYYIACK